MHDILNNNTEGALFEDTDLKWFYLWVYYRTQTTSVCLSESTAAGSANINYRFPCTYKGQIYSF